MRTYLQQIVQGILVLTLLCGGPIAHAWNEPLRETLTMKHGEAAGFALGTTGAAYYPIAAVFVTEAISMTLDPS